MLEPRKIQSVLQDKSNEKQAHDDDDDQDDQDDYDEFKLSSSENKTLLNVNLWLEMLAQLEFKSELKFADFFSISSLLRFSVCLNLI